MKRFACWLLLTLTLAAQPQNPLKDQAPLFLTLAEASANTKDGAALEVMTPTPVLKARPVPFREVGLAPQKVTTARPKTWEMPPFATIGPPGEVVAEVPRLEAPVFSDVDTSVGEAPSPNLRPKLGPRKIQARFSDYNVPEPVSRVCYGSTAGFCQLSLYGGTTSFFAESAYLALQATLENREELQGFGKEAVLGVFKEEIPKAPVLPDKRFESVPVVGKARPELVDPGLNKARKAPAFKDISTETLAGGRLDLSKLPPAGPAKAARAPRNYYVFLAYYPDKAVTVELVIDQRLGGFQDLVQMGLAVQAHVKAI